jgi:hypothetical protein
MAVTDWLDFIGANGINVTYHTIRHPRSRDYMAVAEMISPRTIGEIQWPQSSK